jgi:hypothetical protein
MPLCVISRATFTANQRPPIRRLIRQSNVHLGYSRLVQHIPHPPRLCFRPVRSLRFVSTPQLELCWSLPLPYPIKQVGYD